MQTVSRRILSLVIAVAVCFGIVAVGRSNAVTYVVADAADAYYAPITATSGNALLGQVHDLITTTHTKYTTYNDCKDPAYVRRTDPDGTGELLEFYAQATLSSTWQSGASGTWNREHVWCQSLSNGLWGQTGGGSDLLHIRPTESRVNSARNNNKYGMSSTKTEVRYRDKENTLNVLAGYRDGASVFEPIDSVKGDVARIVMYVYTHYNTYSNVYGTTNGKGSASYFGTLKFTNVMSATSEEAAIEMLLEWHASDPVDELELARNEAAFEIQGNRNPFVDHPEYANAIWGSDPSVELESLSLDKTSFTLRAGKSEKLTVTAEPSNAVATVAWTSSDEKVATVSENGEVTAKAAGKTTVTATSTVNPAIKATAQVTVIESTLTTATITLDSFNLTDSYGFKTWSAGELGGIAYIYGGSSAYPASSGMQFNKSQSSYYLASNKPATGGIKSVTVISYAGTADRDWKLLTSASPYGEVTGKPTNGTDHGTKTVTEGGTTWTLSGEDTYFALTYELASDKGAGYLASVIVEYGEDPVEIPEHEHVDENNDGFCDVCDEEMELPEQPGVDEAKVQAFREAVGSIVTEGTLESRRASLNRAYEAYNALNEEEQALVKADFEKLMAAIGEYKQTLYTYNQEAETANEAALRGTSGFFRWIDALINALKSLWSK